MTGIREIIERHDYHEALAFLTWVLSFKSEKDKQAHLKTMYHQFLSTDRALPEAKDGDVLFLRSLGREDYALLFGAIAASCDHPRKVMVNTFATRSVEKNDKALKFLTNHIDLIDKIRVRDPIDRQCAFLQLMTFGIVLEQYADARLDALVCFSDMQPIENLFARYFRSKAVPTVTCQHGLYIDYGEYKTINCINYLHQPSDHFLAWGEDTASIIRAYHPEANLHLCGKPVFHRGKVAPTGDTGKKIQIILDQPIFNAQNVEMIKIVKEYASASGHMVSVRYHPGIHRATFLQAVEALDESTDFMSADIVVGHTSSLLLEALVLGKKVIQFKSQIPAVDLPQHLQFRDRASLAKALEADHDPSLSQNYFSLIGEKSRAAYREFFQSLFAGTAVERAGSYEPPARAVKTHRWFHTLTADFFFDPTVSQPQGTAPSPAASRTPDDGSSLSTIVMPCLLSDIPGIKKTFEHWCHPAFAPSTTGRKVKLIVVFNTINDLAAKELEKAWQDRPRLTLFFSELIIRSADLSGDRDLYVKGRSSVSQGAFGNIAGPNFLFHQAMEHASEHGGFAFQMELDCVPLASGWIDELDRVVARSSGCWVIGAFYNGDFGIYNPVRFHVNGNALYNVGDPEFMGFLREKWMPRLIALSGDYPNLAYDCWWAIEGHRADTRDITSSSAWNLTRSYASFFHPDPYILNYLKSDPLGARFSEHYRFFEKLGKRPVFLHHADAASFVDKVIAGEAESVTDLLLREPEAVA